MSKYAPEIEEVNPNLIPIMNLFTALIPFLLMSAVFFRLSIIQISVPVASESGETDISKEDEKITLNVQIFPDRFELSASSDTLPPDKIKKLKATVPIPQSDVQEATYEEVSDQAYRIKGKYILSDTAIVVPEDDIVYDIVVGAMDAVRNINKDDGRITLFPKVVLSSRVK